MRVNANTHTPCGAAERGYRAEREDAAERGYREVKREVR